MERFTLMSTEATALPDTAETTSSATAAHTTTTTYKSSQPRPTTAPVTPFDCTSMAYLTGATPVTTTRSMPTTSSNGGRGPSADTTGGSPMLGVAVYSFNGCLWAQASYGAGTGDKLTYRCSMACPERKRAGNLAREVMVDDWDWERG